MLAIKSEYMMVQRIRDIFQSSDYTDTTFVARLVVLNTDYGWGLSISEDDPITVVLDALGLLSSPALITAILTKLREIGLPLPDDATTDDIFDLLHVDNAKVAGIISANTDRDWQLVIDEASDWATTLLEVKTLVKDNLEIILTKLVSIGYPLTLESTFEDILALPHLDGLFALGLAGENKLNNWGTDITADMSWDDITIELDKISSQMTIEAFVAPASNLYADDGLTSPVTPSAVPDYHIGVSCAWEFVEAKETNTTTVTRVWERTFYGYATSSISNAPLGAEDLYGFIEGEMSEIEIVSDYDTEDYIMGTVDNSTFIGSDGDTYTITELVEDSYTFPADNVNEIDKHIRGFTFEVEGQLTVAEASALFTTLVITTSLDKEIILKVSDALIEVSDNRTTWYWQNDGVFTGMWGKYYPIAGDKTSLFVVGIVL